MSFQTKIQQNLMALGCLQVVFEKTKYSFAYQKITSLFSLLKYRFTTYKISERNVKPKWEKEYSFVLGGNLKGA